MKKQLLALALLFSAYSYTEETQSTTTTITISDDHQIWELWEELEGKKLTSEEKKETICSIQQEWLPDLKKNFPNLWQSYYDFVDGNETRLVLLAMGRIYHFTCCPF